MSRIPIHVSEAVNEAVANLKDRPAQEIKKDMEVWLLDKLMVGRITMMAFIEGIAASP
jgi:hypothetical protein